MFLNILISFVNISGKPSQLKVFLDIRIIVTMSYTVMSDEILKEFDSKIYYAVTKIRSDRKRGESNAIHKEVIKILIFKDIT